jgi:low temperature requirement protein LtrA
MNQSNNSGPTPDERDRQAMRREQWADIRYFAGVTVLFAISLGAAIFLIRGGLDPVWRIALSIVPPALAALGGGLWSLRVAAFDERQKHIAYRATSFGALALGGMYTGAAAAWGVHETAARGLIVLAFCALPLLLLWSAFFNAFLLRNWK